jgi:hypothetical protein
MAFGSSAEKLDTDGSAPKTPKLKPTSEQQQIIDATMAGENVSVKAFAGTGKTSTQVMIAEAFRASSPGKYLTYFAYNRAMADEARLRFPVNTTVSTAHALAARSSIHGKPIASRYMKRLVMGAGLKTLRDRISEDLRRDVDRVRAYFPREYTAVTAIMGTLQNFLQSDAREVKPKHASLEHALYIKDMQSVETAHEFTRAVCESAQSLWDRMQSDLRFPVTHDVYLKAWEMDGDFSGRDLVLFDEAQDANPVMISVLRKMHEAGSQVVLVGDPHQAIYAWRGAVDAMHAFPEFTQLSLTESWRFGQNIADKAQTFLDAAGETQTLKGRNPNPGVFLDQRRGMEGSAESFMPDAILCRTNAGVIMDTLEAIQNGMRPYIVGNAGSRGGGAEDAAKLLSAMSGLYDGAGNRPRHPEIALFENWADLVEFSEGADGKQLKAFVKFTMEQKQHGTLDRAIDALKNQTAKTIEEADITICTMHKSKGLEWPKVRVGSDIETVDIVNAHRYNNGQDLAFSLSQENYKLLYVAWTRGKEGFDASGRHKVYEDQIRAMHEYPLTDEIREIIRNERAAKIAERRETQREFSAPND